MPADDFHTSLFASKFIGLAQNRTKNTDNKTKKAWQHVLNLCEQKAWQHVLNLCENKHLHFAL